MSLLPYASLTHRRKAYRAGDVVLLSDTDHSNVASVEITSGITSTYGEYIFKLYNVNPATYNTDFDVQFNASGQSGYNETITSTYFKAKHFEDDSSAGVEYAAAEDQAQGTSGQRLIDDVGNGADEGHFVELHLFNPSSTTYVKHFIARSNFMHSASGSFNSYVAGYINTTAAITDIRFIFSSGNMDATVKMWGVK